MAARPSTTPTAERDASRRLLDEFQRVYALPEGKAVKRVGPPFPPARLEFYRVHDAEQAKILPEGPDVMWFRWGDDKPGLPSRAREGKLAMKGIGWVGDEGEEIASLVDFFTGVRPYEMLGDEKLMRTKVSGDWVLRDGATLERILQGLEAVLQEDCKVPVRFRLVQKDRQVIVAEGKYAFHPLPGNAGITDEAYVPWDRIDLFEKDRGRLMEEGGGSLGDVLSTASLFINRPIVSEVSRLPENPVCWRWSARRFREARERGDVDEAGILKHLGEQTGLTFSEKTRRVRVLLVERVERKDP